MRTVGAILDDYKGIGPGFDFLRIALAILILFSHSIQVITGSDSQYTSGPALFLVRALLPMFFCLSGFLVTGSAQRLVLSDFLLNRGLRIVPALAVDIVVAACIIGTVYTTEPLASYLTDPLFFRYFANVTGFISYRLPGVFITNPVSDTVNASLWTIPFEIFCYIIMSIFIATGAIKRRSTLVGAGVIILFVLAGTAIVGKQLLLNTAQSADITPYRVAAGLSDGLYLLIYFVAGCFTYAFRDRIPYSWLLAAVSLMIIGGVAFASTFSPGHLHFKISILAPFLTYITVFIGLQKIPPVPYFHRGDYSYGVYLYGFPIQQALQASFPSSLNLGTHFALSLLITTGFATFSWHCVEKPILRLRRKFSFTARKTEPAEQVLPTPEPGSALSDAAAEAAPLASSSLRHRL